MKKRFSYIFVLALLTLLIWRIYTDWPQVKQVEWKISADKFILFLLVSLPIPLVNAFSWHLITRSLGGKTSFKDNLTIWTLSNLARFLPGGFWQYPGRVYLSAQQGAGKIATTTAVFLEAIFNASIAAVVALVAIKYLHWPLNPALAEVLFPLSALGVTFILLLSFPKFLQAVLRVMFKVLRKPDNLSDIHPKPFFLAMIIGSILLQIILAGATLYLISSFAASSLSIGMFAFVGIFSAGWLLGYLTILAPAGLGVQEVSIAAFLSYYMPLPVAGLIAVAFRVTLIVSEMLTVLLVLFGRTGKK